VLSKKGWQQQKQIEITKKKCIYIYIYIYMKFGSYRLYKDFTISKCTFGATHVPDALKHVPDLFGRAPGPESRVEGHGTGK